MDKNFSVIRKISEGGYGKVYLVKNSIGQKYVIKTVPVEIPAKYTLNEFQIMRNLNNPRIIKLIDFYSSTNAFHFVLEFAPKGSLRDLVSKYQNAKWKLSNDNLTKLFMDISFGVQYLHSKKIIHRDLKPENILIDDQYRLKLADFGISKIVQNIYPQYQTSIGTLSYMSPEVYLHKPYDQSCDIWALGLILYELAFMKYFLTRDEKILIMNIEIPYRCPVVNWSSRNYDQRFQTLLEMMVQRQAANRSNIEQICRFNLLRHAYELCKLETFTYQLEKMNGIHGEKTSQVKEFKKY